MATPSIPGFTRHGRAFRVMVPLNERDAKAVAAEAAREDMPVAMLVRRAMRAWLAGLPRK